MIKKIGFWGVLSLVVGSQIGSGVFMLPTSLAPYGIIGLWGWVISGVGAITLALVFASLCSTFPKTGGPHAYVKAAFGDTLAFFTGWTYWVISWVSSIAVIKVSIGYLTPVIGYHGPIINLIMEMSLLLIITMINLKGIKAAGMAEFILSCLKVIPLFVIPIIALFFFKMENFEQSQLIQEQTLMQNLSQVTLLTLWGFIGLESATTPAGSVEKASTTIPRAVITGTILVAILYIVNSASIMGAIPTNQLIASKAPYADAAKLALGGDWYILISLISSIICIGTLNAWVLASGQIALGAAQDNLFPKIFAYKNKNDSPYVSLIISSIGILPFLFLTLDQNLAGQVNFIIDISVSAFLLIYIACILSLLKILINKKTITTSKRMISISYSLLALIFCIWIISNSSSSTLLYSTLFVFSGIPVCFYNFYYKKSINSLLSVNDSNINN